MTGKLPTANDVIVHEQTTVYEGFHKVMRGTLTCPRFDGADMRIVRERVDRNDSAGLLLLHKTRGAVVLIEQFRYPALQAGPAWMLEIPAGAVGESADGSSEAPLEAALRECTEESGFRAATPRFLGAFYTSPGGLSERVHLFWAHVDEASSREVLESYGLESEGEDVRVVEMPIDEFIERARAGALEDAKTLIAGLWLALRRGDLGV